MKRQTRAVGHRQNQKRKQPSGEGSSERGQVDLLVCLRQCARIARQNLLRNKTA
jgi:hypothetical protein